LADCIARQFNQNGVNQALIIRASAVPLPRAGHATRMDWSATEDSGTGGVNRRLPLRGNPISKSLIFRSLKKQKGHSIIE
jgi:hypothetical protein